MTGRTRRLIGMALFISIVGCGSIPRIVFLHDPLTPQEHVKLGLSYESQHDWKAAEKEYLAALDLDPKFQPALAILGNVYAEQEQYEAAEKVYRRLLDLNPNHAMANNNLAWIYIVQGIRLSEASERIERALSADSEHRAFYLDTQALLELKLGHLEEARTASLQAESARGSDNPNFVDQHRATRSKIESAFASVRFNRMGDP